MANPNKQQAAQQPAQQAAQQPAQQAAQQPAQQALAALYSTPANVLAAPPAPPAPPAPTAPFAAVGAGSKRGNQLLGLPIGNLLWAMAKHWHAQACWAAFVGAYGPACAIKPITVQTYCNDTANPRHAGRACTLTQQQWAQLATWAAAGHAVITANGGTYPSCLKYVPAPVTLPLPAAPSSNS